MKSQIGLPPGISVDDAYVQGIADAERARSTPIAIELLRIEANALRGYGPEDWRGKRFAAVQAELQALGEEIADEDEEYADGKILIAGVLYDAETLEETDEDGPPPDLNPEGDPTRNGAFG